MRLPGPWVILTIGDEAMEAIRAGLPGLTNLVLHQKSVEIHFPEAEKIRVGLDNLNTHSPAAFYEAFSPQQTRYLTKKLEFHYTPEHSSWLNMAEVEISVLTEQCLDRRLGSVKIVESEVGDWEAERNIARATIDWRFTIPNARDKLKKLYPVKEE